MFEQTWKADEYSSHASFVSELGLPVLELLDSRPDEVILDLGCGDGTLARSIQDSGAKVIGVDSSEDMIQSANSKGIEAYVEAGEHIDFVEKFDAVFSNAALHWMPSYASVLAGVYRALKSPGRFVGEFGGSGNISCLRRRCERFTRRRVLVSTQTLGFSPRRTITLSHSTKLDFPLSIWS